MDDGTNKNKPKNKDLQWLDAHGFKFDPKKNHWVVWSYPDLDTFVSLLNIRAFVVEYRPEKKMRRWLAGICRTYDSNFVYPSEMIDATSPLNAIYGVLDFLALSMERKLKEISSFMDKFDENKGYARPRLNWE